MSRVSVLLLFLCSLVNSCKEKTKSYETWGVYRGNAESNAYSSLDQITKASLDRLEVAWEYHGGDVLENEWLAIECNPIIIKDIIYFTTAKLKLVALDAATGTEKWVFDPFENAKANGVNRGVVYCKTDQDQRIFLTAGSRLFCIDAENGTIISSFGESGSIDLRVGLDRDPDKITAKATSPGIIYNNILIQGVSVSEGYGAAPGFIRGYNVLTGEIVWTFRTIPLPGEYGYDTWEEKNHREVGGANAWTGFSLDEKRGLVFVPTGSASFDFYGGYRKGQNLFANSLIALNAKTGERVWHYQLVHHDLWDYDLPAPPTLISLKTDKGMVDAVAQVTKMGWIFIFDRETGEPVFPIEERAVPQSTLPGEQSWPTQPIPVKPPPFVRQYFDENSINNITPGTEEYIKEFLKGANYGSIYTPPGMQGTVQMPGTSGGAEWGGPAFDPESGIMYVNANEFPDYIKLKPISTDEKEILDGRKLFQLNSCTLCHGANLTGVGVFPSLIKISRSREEVLELLNNGKGQMPAFSNLSKEQKEALTEYLFNPNRAKENEPSNIGDGDLKYVHDSWNILKDDNGYFGIKPPWGTLNAIDLNKGEILWQVPLGVYPNLIEKGIPPTGRHNLGGPLVTKGGLIFIGATGDEKFRAFDKETGKVLWEFKLPGSGMATPSTYMVDQEQYIVIAAGGGGRAGTQSGDGYVAFKLKSK